MNQRWLTGIALLLLGAGMITGVVLGPLVLGAIRFRVSASAENQLLGGDWVTLLVVAPLALLAGVLWLRGHPLAPLLAMSPLYAAYTYVTFVLGADYDRYPGNNEKAFPLYWLLIVLGWAIALRAWNALGARPLLKPSSGLRRSLAWLLLGVSLLFALAWTRSIATVILGGSPPAGYADDPTLFWLIRLLDLGLVIPAGLVGGIGLLRGAPWSIRPAYALTGFLTPFVASIAGMAIVMAVRHDPAADSVLLVASIALMTGLGVPTLLLYRQLLHAADPVANPPRTVMQRPSPTPAAAVRAEVERKRRLEADG